MVRGIKGDGGSFLAFSLSETRFLRRKRVSGELFHIHPEKRHMSAHKQKYDLQDEQSYIKHCALESDV